MSIKIKDNWDKMEQKRVKNHTINTIFLGAGNIAVPVLEKLVTLESVNLVNIGTQMDQPAGRKRKLHPTPVAQWCETNNIPVSKYENVNSPETLDYFKSLNPDIILVVSFGQIFKKELLELPKACVNIHASILPKYRGASPIITALLNGDKETGVTFMEMEEGLDTGGIYDIFTYSLQTNKPCYIVEHELGELAGKHLEATLSAIYNGKKPIPQDHTQATLTKKIKKQDGQFKWDEPAQNILNKIRAFNPWPCAVFTLKGKKRDIQIKILEGELVEHSGRPGEVLTATKNEWIVACKDNAIRINRIIPQGKKEMSGADFLRGTPLKAGDIL